ncbi:hypothetical protein [Mycobacteroides abscessus]|uniref:hypothetical protein n=1 Tax=Mycobacteroides abscessus TaxID=36809 RepID=UPI001041D01C|nr:hypothetical protein [Mycobacteroides abscessus]
MAGWICSSYSRDMQIYPFANTAAFGATMKALREYGEHASLQRIQDAGGPSDTQQGRIEAGEAMKITSDTMTKYDAAYSQLLSFQDPPAWYGSNQFGEGFVKALAAVYAATADENGIADRRQLIEQQAARTPKDKLFLGVDLHTERPVFGVMLTRYESHKKKFPDRMGAAQSYIDTQMMRDGDIRTLSMRIAQRHPSAITLTDKPLQPGPLARKLLAEQGEYEPWPGTVQRNGYGRYDPIANVRSLTAAKQRAKALGAPSSGGAVDAVGWMILLVNILTDTENATTTATLTPLQTWMQYHNSAAWDRLRATMPENVAGSVPDTELMVSATTSVLSPWIEARTVPQFEVTYKIQDKAKDQAPVTWNVASLSDQEPLVPKAGDLWETRIARLPHVLAHEGISAIVLGGHGVAINMDDDGPAHQWCPSPVRDDLALIYCQEHGWDAIQTY